MSPRGDAREDCRGVTWRTQSKPLTGRIALSSVNTVLILGVGVPRPQLIGDIGAHNSSE
jgi:hypothetical protein